MSGKQGALISLLLLVPVPSIGAFAAMVWMPDTSLGNLIFLFSKIWLFSFPCLWMIFIEKKKLSIPRPTRDGWGFSLISGVVISSAIILCYVLFGKYLIDMTHFKENLFKVGLTEKTKYITLALYWILINSVLEEYVWRWFIVKQSQELVKQKCAIFLSALFFTLHHIVAMQVYFGLTAVALCSLGIFLGGALWSYMYIRYRSIWPGYLSHAIVDVAIFGVGGFIIFS